MVPGLTGAVAQEVGKTTEASAQKPEVLFAVGEWPPMITENAAGYGIHTKRVTEVFEAMGYRVRYVLCRGGVLMSRPLRGNMPRHSAGSGPTNARPRCFIRAIQSQGRDRSDFIARTGFRSGLMLTQSPILPPGAASGRGCQLLVRG